MIKWGVGGLYGHAEDRGGVPEWLKGEDCKSVGVAYAGSNPAAIRFDFPLRRISACPSHLSQLQ